MSAAVVWLPSFINMLSCFVLFFSLWGFKVWYGLFFALAPSIAETEVGLHFFRGIPTVFGVKFYFWLEPYIYFQTIVLVVCPFLLRTG